VSQALEPAIVAELSWPAVAAMSEAELDRRQYRRKKVLRGDWFAKSPTPLSALKEAFDPGTALTSSRPRVPVMPLGRSSAMLS